MADSGKTNAAGEHLVKHEVISREDLDAARVHEAQTGTPWYQQLIQLRKVSFQAVEDVLYYEMHPRAKRQEHVGLGDTLVKLGMLSQAQLKTALKEQKRTGRLLGKVLLDGGMVTREQCAQALARQHEMEYADLQNTPSTSAALEVVPESMAKKLGMLPVDLSGDRISALITDPHVRERLQEASVLLGKRIHPVITACADLREEIGRRYERAGHATPVSPAPPAAKTEAPPAPSAAMGSNKKEVVVPKPTILEEPAAAAAAKRPPTDAARFDDIARQAQGASVIRMVSTIIEGAVNSGATDVHLDPQDPEMRVRYRIDGVLHDVMSIPGNLEAAVASRIKILADLDITNTRLPQDGHISLEIGGREFDVRVATLPTYLGERIVLRLLDQSSVMSGIRDLGLNEDDEKRLSVIIDQPYGMILVTGPTGSGKTTTLYAALNQKNVMTDSIVTLEDPVEYQLSGINQVQIDSDIGLTFAQTLRASLRQDIDVLLVGEIRDAETARIAVRAAMTGHLVFSTLHTNDAPEAIATLRNMDVPSYLISSALTAVIGQRLIRTICAQCRASFVPSAALVKSIGLPATVKKLHRGQGCEVCYRTGNRGRTGIFEIFEIKNEVRKLIAEDAGPEVIAKAAKLKTMAQHCREKVKEGIVAPEEFLKVIRT